MEIKREKRTHFVIIEFVGVTLPRGQHRGQHRIRGKQCFKYRLRSKYWLLFERN